MDPWPQQNLQTTCMYLYNLNRWELELAGRCEGGSAARDNVLVMGVLDNCSAAAC